MEALGELLCKSGNVAKNINLSDRCTLPEEVNAPSCFMLQKPA